MYLNNHVSSIISICKHGIRSFTTFLICRSISVNKNRSNADSTFIFVVKTKLTGTNNEMPVWLDDTEEALVWY